MRQFLLIFGVLFLLMGCSPEKEYYMSMTGDSDSWRIENYQIKITADSFKAGNGELFMKRNDEYKTDSFSIEAHAVINNNDKVISRFSSSAYAGDGMNIAGKQDTGEIESGAYINEDGDPITLDDISNVYVIVEWWDQGKERDMKERIDLYDATDRIGSVENRK
ncbi:hypothetical protein ACW2QC_13520 [Virgibacillus sp. FSP13]